MSSRDVTVVLRPATPFQEGGAEPLSAQEHAWHHGSFTQDERAVRQFAESYGLEVLWTHGEARTMRLRGEDAAVQEAFADDNWPEGVVSVLGASDEPVAKPRLHLRPHSNRSLTAPQVARAYDFPDTDGAGQTLAIIELGGGFGQSDLDTYFGDLKLRKPKVSAVEVSGGRNQSDGADGADGEVLLDIEVAGAVAPGADQVVYFGPNTDAGFLSAINAAIHATPTPAAISISWGGAETDWRKSVVIAFDQAFASATALGITVLAAAGDTGSKDSTRADVADFPASSPNVVACGGTHLVLDSSGAVSRETVWNDDPTTSATGGGYSQVFSKPDYQSAVPGTRRGEPDMSGNADPNSGYYVVVDGDAYIIGGTSAVAPLFAGLVARLNALSGTRVGALNVLAYANPDSFRDITTGDNGSYRAGPGWDAASGLGVPDGGRLLAALQGGAPAPDPIPSPDPVPTPTPDPTPEPAPDLFRDALASYPGLDGHLAGLADRHGQTLEQFAAYRLAKEYRYA